VLTELRLEGFRSIEKAPVPLRQFTCLVGPNNSGKSNILDGLALLRDAAKQGCIQAVSSRGASAVRFFGLEEGGQPKIQATFKPSPLTGFETLEYKLTLVATSNLQGAGVESITGFYTKPAREVIAHTAESTQPGQFQTYVRRPGGQEQQVPGFYGAGNGLLFQFQEDSMLKPLRDDVGSWQFFQFAPEKLKHIGPAQQASELARDGSNFATYLHALHSGNRKAFGILEEQLKSEFPEVEELITPLVPNGTLVGIKERWFSHPALGIQLSDGLVGFLAHLVALYTLPIPRLVVFEEPENYIHPRLMERLVAMLRNASRETQVIITTHSPSLLNRLTLEDIVLVERVDGSTTARRASDSNELKKSLKEWALGDAYVSGLLGGAA
jgi:predicted ATPase